MNPTDEEPLDRETWRQLLATGAGAPARETDRRILAEARHALVPRMGRWWLPASLAASLLLAVLLVQWQLEESAAPPLVTESDVLSAPVPSAMEIDGSGTSSSERMQERAGPAGAAPTVATPSTEIQAPAGQPPPPADHAPGAAAPASPVVREMKADAAAPARAEMARESKGIRAPGESGTTVRNPDEWYAEIEALRAAGRSAEADAELARLEAAWPGWLEERGQPQR